MANKKHTVEVVKPDFNIDEQLNLHETGWIIQRIGWFIMIAIMLAGAIGVFGGGFASKKIVSANNVNVEYERFFRYETEMEIVLRSTEHISNISLPQQYLKDFRIIRFVPEPVHNHTNNLEVVYNFLQGQNQIVTIYIVPKSYGSISGIMKVNRLDALRLNHFIYP